MAVPVGRAPQCRQSVSSSLLYHHVQRSRMVRLAFFSQSSSRNSPVSEEASWYQQHQQALFTFFNANLVSSDSDYINPIDLCNRLNTYIIPEAAVHAFLTFLFLINGYWIALLLNLPLVAFNAKKYVQADGPRCIHTSLF
jgi:hypothetical protein